MAPGYELMRGVDALVTCLVRYTHTSEIIRGGYPNYIPTMRFTNFKVLNLETNTVI